MKRVILAILSGLMLSCQGPAAVLAQEPATTALNESPERPAGQAVISS